MDVKYIKKSKDPKYKIVYYLTNKNFEMFTNESVDNGELKAFI